METSAYIRYRDVSIRTIWRRQHTYNMETSAYIQYEDFSIRTIRRRQHTYNRETSAYIQYKDFSIRTIWRCQHTYNMETSAYAAASVSVWGRKAITVACDIIIKLIMKSDFWSCNSIMRDISCSFCVLYTVHAANLRLWSFG